MRSGTARLDHGPSSTARHQARVSARSWATMVGSVIAMSTRGVLSGRHRGQVGEAARVVATQGEVLEDAVADLSVEGGTGGVVDHAPRHALHDGRIVEVVIDPLGPA